MSGQSPGERFEEFITVIETLMGPEGCPWDQAQTHQSLKRYLIEEAYEVYEAIEEEHPEALQDELGDVLLQVVLHSLLGKKEGLFDIGDVIDGVREKMIRRHPHVFGDASARDAAEVEQRWEQIKKTEKGKDLKGTLLDVPRNLSPLYRAEKIQKRAARVGFCWDEVLGSVGKIEEECQELREALAGNSPDDVEGELGDLLFSVVNVCSFLDIDPADALQKTNDKFVARFQYMEQKTAEEGLDLQDLTLEQKEKFWLEAKKV